jgi:hypothetical protein
MRINYTRVLLGGLVAGVIIDAIEFVVNTFFLGPDWAEAMRRLGRTEPATAAQTALFNVWGLLMGIVAVWTYAAFRPRFGAGPRAAGVAALTIWAAGYLLSMLPPAILELFPIRLIVIAVGVGLLELIVGTVAGAWIYTEEEARTQTRAAGAA